MRDLRYKYFQIGSPGTWKRGTITDMLKKLPTFRYMEISGDFPSRSEINRILLSGEDDGGMSGGCKWNPFSVSEEEYMEIYLELITDPSSNFKISDLNS